MNVIDNPFAVIDRRFNHLENLLTEIKAGTRNITQPEPEAIFTTAQAAEFLHVSEPTIRQWGKKGYIQPRIIGGEIRYLRSELIASLQKPEVKRVAKRKTAKSL